MSGLSTQKIAGPLKGSSIEGVRLSTTHNAARSVMPDFTPTPIGLQPKLTVSTPGDKYEQEADRVAEHVMRMPESTSASEILQRKCAKCDEEDKTQLHRKEASNTNRKHDTSPSHGHRKDTSAKKSILINLADQTLVAKEGENVRFHFDIVSGSSDHETPLSSPKHPFTVTKKVEHYRSRQFDAPMEHSLFFVENRGIAIHESYAVGARSLLKSLGASFVGSHGCVGLSSDDAKSLFGWAPKGTSVEVISGQTTESEMPNMPSNPGGVRRKESGGRMGGAEAPASVHSVINSPGQPLDAATRAFMEPRFGQDFSQVRVHTDTKAVASVQAVAATAYTVGRHIAFRSGAYAPRSTTGRQLLAHELTHVIQQGAGGTLLQGKLQEGAAGYTRELEADTVASDAAVVATRPTNNTLLGRLQRREADSTRPTQKSLQRTTAEYTEPGWSRVNKLGIVRVEEADSKVSGARLRKGASASAEFIHLDENTQVFILAENTATNWLYVLVNNKQYGGSLGYVAKHLIWTGLPDPDAITYYVAEPGLGLQKLVENHPQYQEYDIRTGDDARSIVMAVLLANEKTGGVRLNQSKLQEASNPGTLEGLKDKADEYRRVLRPILQSVELVLGKKIWLPGNAYVNALKGKGIIPTRSDWKNAAIAVGKGVGGFASGLGEGFLMSIADVFIGIYDMIKSIISLVGDLISGKAIQAAEEFYDTVKELSAGELFEMLKDALVQMISSSVKEFSNKWNSNNTYDRWNFRGYIVGYILAEIVMLIFTAGAATIAKWLGKLGKLGAKILKVLGKVFDKVDDVLDKVPGRKGRKKHAGDTDKKDTKKKDDDNKARELPGALILASSIAETHDAQNSPASVALLSLAPLKRRYKWIKRFAKKKTSPGHFRIWMYASEHVIDNDYTPEHDEEDDEAGSAAPSSPTPHPNVLKSSDKLRREARQAWEQVHPGFRDKAAKQRSRGIHIEIDHRVPLEYRRLFPLADPNRLSNLRALHRVEHRRKVSDMWDAFRNTYRRMGREPTPAEVLEYAGMTDRSLNLPYPL